MKIGIMTWFRYYNYGTVLQAYALQEKVKSYKYEPYLIDYMPKGTNIQINDIRTFYNCACEKLLNKRYSSNYNKFDAFVSNYIDKTVPCNSYVELKDIADDYSAFICGSDQIWSPDNFDFNYFLPFASENKIISYAPSIGKDKINSDILSKKMSELISRFKYLSVREEKGKNIIKELCELDAQVVVDPTLLLNAKEWSKLIDKKLEKSLLNKKYILCYFLGPSNKYYTSVTKCANENGYSIINVPTLNNQKLNFFNPDIEIGPIEFLTFLKNASLVMTDSFHGTIFSINFNVDFYTYKRFKDNDKRSQNSRIVDILKKLDLSNRMIDPHSLKDSTSIDYDSINIKVEKIRNDSATFLSESLKKATTQFKTQSSILNKVTDICCGCGACQLVCPKKAISIVKNKDGFYEYTCNEDMCIGCNICKRVCPMLQISSIAITDRTKCFYFKAINNQVLKKSSSGGAGYELAKYLNTNGYYVCGSFYDNDINEAKHIVINPDKQIELKKIQGSKYLQSYTAEAFEELLKLPSSAKVVFFGTPCQVAALSKILNIKKLRKNYILVDLICHGVPSYLLWDEYLLEINRKYNNTAKVKVLFRNKKYGWKDRRITIKNSKVNYSAKDCMDPFYFFFKNGATNNISCFECPYRLKSSADIRIGDYWSPLYYEDKDGVSMVLTVTKLGYELLKKIDIDNIVEEKDINDFFKYQQIYNLNSSIFRDNVLNDLREHKSIRKIKRKYFKYSELKDKCSALYLKIRRLKNEK